VDVTGGAAADNGVVSKSGWIAVLVVMVVASVGNFVWAGLWLVRRRGASAATVLPVAAAGKGLDT
jgi:hypothetical protein